MSPFDVVDRPDPTQIEAARAEIFAFRDENPALGNAALAIAFIGARGSATSAELGLLLDLGPGQYPSAVLASSVIGGRLAREGKTWTLGPKAVPSARDPDGPVDEPAAAEKGADQPLKDLKRALRTSPIHAPTAASTAGPAVAPTAAPVLQPAAKSSGCRFALWSDGVVEIKKRGLPPVELTLDEVDELITFLTKMGEA